MSCNDEDIEQHVMFYGNLYVYDVEGQNSQSEWNGLSDTEVSLIVNKSEDGCSIFHEREVVASSISNSEGFYEFSVPLSSSGISYETNRLGAVIITFTGCPSLDIKKPNQFEIIATKGKFTDIYVEAKDYYFGREAELTIETSLADLDSAYVTIDNLSELIDPRTFSFFKSEYRRYGEVLGEDLQLTYAYDPNPTYQIEVQKFKDGQLTQENFDIELDLNQVTFLEIR